MKLAKAVKPKSDDHNPYMKAESVLAGSMAWGKVDYMLVYHAIGIMVVESVGESVEVAVGQWVKEGSMQKQRSCESSHA